jgi:hypothetical protein
MKMLCNFKDILTDGNKLPKSKAPVKKKLIFPLRMEVQKIHACIKDYILYHREEYKDLRSCPIYGHP